MNASHSRSVRGRRRAAGIAISAIALAVAACGPGGASTSPSASTSAPTAPTASPSVAPSAVDVSAVFVEIITDPDFSGRADIDGTIGFASIEGEAGGEFEFNGEDTRTEITLTLAGQEQTTETITVDRRGFDRTDGGPWVEEEEPVGDDPQSLAELLGAVSSLEDTGVETRDGRELHHLELPDGGEIPAEAMGIDTSVLKDPEFTMEFFAQPDGTPAILTIVGTWTQAINAQDVDAEMTLDFSFKDLGEDVEIEAPDDVWEKHVSQTFGYEMAHPADWTVTSNNEEDQFLFEGQPYIWVVPQDTPAGMDLAGLRAALLETYEPEFGGQPDEDAQAQLDNTPAVRLVYHATIDGNDLVFVDYATIHGGDGWEVFLITAAGSGEDADIALFEEFVTTFEFTE